MNASAFTHAQEIVEAFVNAATARIVQAVAATTIHFASESSRFDDKLP